MSKNRLNFWGENRLVHQNFNTPKALPRNRKTPVSLAKLIDFRANTEAVDDVRKEYKKACNEMDIARRRFTDPVQRREFNNRAEIYGANITEDVMPAVRTHFDSPRLIRESLAPILDDFEKKLGGRRKPGNPSPVVLKNLSFFAKQKPGEYGFGFSVPTKRYGKKAEMSFRHSPQDRIVVIEVRNLKPPAYSLPNNLRKIIDHVAIGDKSLGYRRGPVAVSLYYDIALTDIRLVGRIRF